MPFSSSDARPFRAAGSGSPVGRPATNIDTGGAARALVAARRFRYAMENRPGGGGNDPTRKSIMSGQEVSALRGYEKRRAESTMERYQRKDIDA